MAKNTPDPRHAATVATFGTAALLAILESGQFKALAKELPAFIAKGNDEVAKMGEFRRMLTKEEQAAIVSSKLTTAVRNASLGKWD